MPAPWQEQLSGSFQQLLLIHLVRQECFVPAAQQYVSQHFGKGFTEPEPWTLDQVFEESSAGTPIIFILSTGTAASGDTSLTPVQHLQPVVCETVCCCTAEDWGQFTRDTA
jgi:hypothetical protein